MDKACLQMALDFLKTILKGLKKFMFPIRPFQFCSNRLIKHKVTFGDLNAAISCAFPVAFYFKFGKLVFGGKG